MGSRKAAECGVSSSDWAGARVCCVEPGSAAERVGIAVGDFILSLNGHPIGDVIDLWFHGTARRLDLRWRQSGPDGPVRTAVVRKTYQERLGIELHPFETRCCNNRCVFCFVHQLPPGLRRELYVKDEDYRLSFLHGNYITGTNLSPGDKERIARLKLSPLYFSVHASDEELRGRILGNPGAEPILPLMRWLAGRGIQMHAQIVLCPGLNDGAALEKTVTDLAGLYPSVESVAVVPVGLISHRRGLPALQPVTPEYAREFVAQCASMQRSLRGKLGFPFVFASDEFWLCAGMDVPSYDEFPEIPQSGNGVGMVHAFYEDYGQVCSALPAETEPASRVAAITTELGAAVLRRIVDSLNARVRGLRADILAVQNSLFGPQVTVSGLIPGADFRRAISEHPHYDRYVIPANALRTWDNRFLDDLLLEDLRAATTSEIAVGGDTAGSFAAAVLGRASLAEE